MDTTELIFLLSLVIYTLGMIFMVDSHKSDILIEIKFYQFGIMSFVASIYLQSGIYFFGNPSLSNFDILTYKFAFVFNSIGLLLLFLMLYIPEFEFSYTQIIYFLLSTSIFILAGVINANSIQLTFVNDSTIIQVSPLGLVLNSLTVIVVLTAIINRFRKIFTHIEERGRKSKLMTSMIILTILSLISVFTLLYENIVGFISVQLPNLFFSIVLFYFIIIISKNKYEMFLTKARLAGYVILDAETLSLIHRDEDSTSLLDNSDRFIEGPFSALFKNLNDSILSVDKLQGISFGPIQLLLYSRYNFLIIYFVSQNNLIVERILSKYSYILFEHLNNTNGEITSEISNLLKQMKNYF